MTDSLFWFGAGLLVGWNLLPQPWFVKLAYDAVVSMIKNWIIGVKKDNPQ